MILGSFCRSEPAAALRGLANGALSSATSDSFSFANSSTAKNTSPRTSRVLGSGCSSVAVSRRGMTAMVATLAVTSSPNRPSPRVAARVSRPFSYSRSIASPSTFSSHR